MAAFVASAISRGDVEALRAGVTSGLDLNAPVEGVTPLCLAARLGRRHVVEFLLQQQVPKVPPIKPCVDLR